MVANMTRQHLEEMASYNPASRSMDMTIEEICKLIQKKRIVIPSYQRDMVWTIPKCVDLLNYQLLGKAPVAAVSMNQINDKYCEVPQYSFIGRAYVCGEPGVYHQRTLDVIEPEFPIYSIIDGQQRFTTNYKAFIDSPDFLKIALDLSIGKFRIAEPFEPNIFPAGKLYNESYEIFYDYLQQNFEPQDYSLLNSIRSKFMSYKYHVNLANDMDLDEQVEWFIKLNNAGTSVSEVQLNISKLKLRQIDVYNLYVRPFIQKIKDADLYDIIPQAKAQASIPIACLNPMFEILNGHTSHKTNYSPIPSDEKTSAIVNFSHDQIVDCFDSTLAALDKTLKFYHRVGIAPQRFEYVSFLVGYFILVVKDGSPDDKRLVEWFRSTNFRDKTNTQKREIYTNLLEL